MDSIEQPSDYELRISLAPIAGSSTSAFALDTTLDDDDVFEGLSSFFVRSRVNICSVVGDVSDTLVGVGRIFLVVDIKAQNSGQSHRGRHTLSLTGDVTIGYYDHDPVIAWILGLDDAVDGFAQYFVTIVVATTENLLIKELKKVINKTRSSAKGRAKQNKSKTYHGTMTMTGDSPSFAVKLR